MHDAAQERFGKTAERVAALQDARAAELEAKVVGFAELRGDQRALDSAAGAGALAFAFAPHVREVVAVDLVPELLEQGRQRASRFENVEFVEAELSQRGGDGMHDTAALAGIGGEEHLARFLHGCGEWPVV